MKKRVIKPKSHKAYNISLGSLVEIKDTGVRLYVVKRYRDRGGKPLYRLCYYQSWKNMTFKKDENQVQYLLRILNNQRATDGYMEESLKIIR